MILGDNFFYESQLSKRLKNCVETLTGATVFAYPVKDPRQYGNIEFFGSGKIKAIHEKPVEAYSPYVVPGLYFYDETVLEKSSSLNLSPRGELEVTDLNNLYLAERSLGVEMLGRGCAWIDMGTHERLLEAGQFISGVEKCTGLKIACLEEVAYRNGYISTEKFRNLSEICPNSSYGEYLKMLANELCPPAKESAEPEQFTVAAAAADLLDFSAHP